MTPQNVVSDHIRDKAELISLDPRTVIGHIRQEQSVRNDYMGRAPYELLQNAIDRASSMVAIILCSETRTLTVANDGKSFSYKPQSDDRWSDFAALCAVNSSNKPAGESIGNKGVGFRSIWEVCKQVRVASCLEDNENEFWGFRLYFPFTTDNLGYWDDKELAHKVKSTLDNLPGNEKGKAPSFYFPELLDNAQLSLAGSVTEVTLENLSDRYLAQLEELLGHIEHASLMFASHASDDKGAFSKGLIAEFNINGKKSNKKLSPDIESYHLVEVDTSELVNKDNQHFLDDINYQLKRSPQLVLAIPKYANAVLPGLFHCYLPTELETGSCMHVQGDFYLDVSRKHIDFDENPYNKFLLNLAAKQICDDISTGKLAIPLQVKCNLLVSDGPFHKLFQKWFKSGADLAELLVAIVVNASPLSFSDIEALFNVIGFYAPERCYRGRYSTHDLLLANYIKHFSRDDLLIVPLSAIADDANAGASYPECVKLPIAPKGKSGSSGLFCLSKNAVTLPVQASGVTVTSWRFPDNMAESLKRLHIWSEYQDAEAVIRAIVRAQKESDETKRIGLLEAAVVVDGHGNDYVTRWRFTGRDNYSSQRLLVPTVSELGWTEASLSYFDDIDGLSEWSDSEVFYPIDVKRAHQYLGDDFKCQLLHWGVWNVIPLRNNGTTDRPEWGLSVGTPTKDTVKSKKLNLNLLAKSKRVWALPRYYEQNLNAFAGLVKILKENQWLAPDIGARCNVSPQHCYLMIGEHSLDNVPSMLVSEASEDELELFRWLGVRTLDKESDSQKLIYAARCIVNSIGSATDRKCRTDYGKVISRLDTLRNELDSIPDDFPLLIEDNLKLRIALPTEIAFYLSRDARNRLNSIASLEKSIWVVPRETSRELADRIPNIESCEIKMKLKIAEEELILDENSFEKLKLEILPILLAYTRSASEINRDPDEDGIRRRWAQVSVKRADNAELQIFGPDGVILESESESLAQNKLLWLKQTYADRRAPDLIIKRNYDWTIEKDYEALGRWFAEEIFRIAALQKGFSLILLQEGKDIDSSAIKECRNQVEAWLSDEKETEIAKRLGQLINKNLEHGQWRNIKSYNGAGVSFKQIKKTLPANKLWLIQHLDPTKNNESNLRDWLESHSDKLVVLNKSLGEIIRAFLKDGLRDSYDFEIEKWVLAQLDITSEDFERLDYGVDTDLALLRLENRVVDLPDDEVDFSPSFVLGKEMSVDSGTNIGEKVRLVTVKTQESRNEDAEYKAKKGANAEKQLAMEFAKKINSLKPKEQEHVFNLINIEFQRLEKHSSNDMPAPQNEKEWYELIHLGRELDGCGYDLIGYDSKVEKLLLVEAKSTESTPPEIFISENERKKIVFFTSEKFFNDFPLVEWKLYLSSEDKATTDVTDAIQKAVNQHHVGLQTVNRLLVAESWRLKLLTS